MEIHQLETEVSRLESLIADQGARNRRAVRGSLIVTSTLVCVVLLFVAVNLINFRREFTSENLRRNLAMELQELGPAATRELSMLGRDVLPAYAEEARRQLAKVGPRLTARLEQEADRLVADTLTGTGETLRETERRLLEGAERTIQEKYPALRDPSFQADLERRFHSALDRSLEEVLRDFMDRYKRDVESIQEKLLKFDLSDTNETGVDLQKKFLRLWLQLLEEEIAAI